MQNYRKYLSVVLALALVVTSLWVCPAKSVAADYGEWDCVYFGNYWQEDTNGDGVADQRDAKTPIKWRILQQINNKALLLADQCLDAQPYNTAEEDVTWENCTLRSWLNGTFMNEAFNLEEQNAIYSETNTTEGDIFTAMTNDYTTIDRLFVLSEAEITNTSYGFEYGYNQETNTRTTTNTAYCANLDGRYPVGEMDNFWLRNQGQANDQARAVTIKGVVLYQTPVNRTDVGVRPALYLDMDQVNVWKQADKVTASALPAKTPTIEATDKPIVVPEAVSFNVSIGYASTDFTESNFDVTKNNVTVNGDGDYTVSYKAVQNTSDIFVLGLDTDLHVDDVPQSMTMTATKLTVGSQEYILGACDVTNDENRNYRLGIRNPYDGAVSNRALGNTIVPVTAGDTITIYFTVSGTGVKNPDAEENPETPLDIGSSVWFGSYIQNLVTDEDTISILKDSEFTNDKLEKQGIHFAKKDRDYYQDAPIEWQILADEGNCYMLISKKVLLSRSYGGEEFWDASDIRTWLNQDFYDEAFSENEKNSILTTTLSTLNWPYEDRYLNGIDAHYVDTQDKVYLLTHEEVQNSKYGFEEGTDVSDSRVAYTTQYADINESASRWWLRGEGHWNYGNLQQRYVTAQGEIAAWYETYSYGVRPVIRVEKSAVATTRPEEEKLVSGDENEKPNTGVTAPEFNVSISYASTDFTESAFDVTKNNVTVKGDGDYAVSYTATKSTSDIHVLGLDTDLHVDDVPQGMTMTATKLTVGSQEYTLGTCDITNDENGNYRIGIRNPYDSAVSNRALGNTIVPVTAGDTITIYFTVRGTGVQNPDAQTQPTPQVSAEPEASPSTTPQQSPSASPSSTTKNDTTSQSTTSTKVKEVSKLGKVKLESCKSQKKGKITVKWKKAAKANGYQIQYSKKRSFAGKKTRTIRGKSLTVSAKSKKIYYVRVRAYRYGNIKYRVYGKWSKVKKVKVK